MTRWDPSPPDPEGDSEHMAKRAEALAAVREAIRSGDLDTARRDLAAVEAMDRRAGDPLADLDTANTPEALRRVLDRVAPEPDPIEGRIRTDWTTPPPARRWLADGWLPEGRVAMLTGPGGAGKSRLALQVAAAVASGRSEAVPALPSIPTGDEKAPTFGGDPAPVLYVGWEDEPDEVARRLGWLSGAGLRSVGGLGDRLHYLDAAGIGPLWAPDPDGSGHVSTRGTWTPGGLAVLERARAIDGLALLIVDPLAAAFGSNENDRALVREWLAVFGDFAARRGCAVLLIGHPAKASEGEASRYSGSTDWRNGVRALWTLTTERVPGRQAPKRGDGTTDRAACLTLDKASYGPAGARAWLRLDGDGTGKGLAWRECAPGEALTAYADRRGLPPAPADAEANGAGPMEPDGSGRLGWRDGVARLPK